jgi:hypothetical protein
MRSLIDEALLTRIREQVVPISIETVILAIGYFTFLKMPPRGTAGDIVAWFLLLAVFCIVFSLFPAIAIAVGWYTGNRAGAFLAGVLPLPVISVSAYFLVRSTEMVFVHADTAMYIAVLLTICGLAGYCAAMRTKNYLALSVILTGIWLVVWMSGFN